jgi:3-oxoacyl-[acyl-carrier-protein] synthase II
VAIQCRISGAGRALIGREAGPLLALRQGVADLRRGSASRALVGSVEEAPPLLHALLDRFGSLARARNGSAELARPFDRRRCGCLLAEGATLFLLEPEAQARRREAPILARVLATGSAFDPTASRVGWGEGAAQLAAALRDSLSRHDVALDTIDAVVTGAAGSVAGDRIEARLCSALWPERMPPVVAPKAVTGEYGGAFLAAALLALEGFVPGHGAEIHAADQALGVVPHTGPRIPPIARLLVTSVASGGPAAWAVLERA